MSEASPNRGLFRIYAAECLIGSAFAFAVAYQLMDVSNAIVTVYLAIGVALWGIDMAVTGTRRSPTAREGRGLAHAVLLAAFALVWPLAVVAVVAFLGWGVVKALQQSN